MLRIKDATELQLRHAAGRGYIYNDFAGMHASGKLDNILHKAGCRTLARGNMAYPKLFFATKGEAHAWLKANRGEDWKSCGICKP